jgi:hypothetical protein
LDEFFKILYEKVLVACSNPDLLIIILDISEALMMNEGVPNKLGVTVNLRMEKKQLIAQRIIKRTVRMAREEHSTLLHNKMSEIVTNFLLSNNLAENEEFQHIYEIVLLFF